MNDRPTTRTPVAKESFYVRVFELSFVLILAKFVQFITAKVEILLTVIAFNNTSDLQLCVRGRRMPKGQRAISINHRPAKANY